MAADVKAPRIARSTTNMEDAAAAAKARAASLKELSVTTGADAALLASYENWRQALAIYNVPRERDDNAAEQAAIDLICAEEERIRAATATTPKGVEAQLWVFMENSTTDQIDAGAIQRGDIQHFAKNTENFDWEVRLVIAAIASLQAMHGDAA